MSADHAPTGAPTETGPGEGLGGPTAAAARVGSDPQGRLREPIRELVARLVREVAREELAALQSSLNGTRPNGGPRPRGPGRWSRCPAGDYDEGRRLRLRAATTKTRRALWIELHPVLAEAIEASLRPREDRDLAAKLFPESGADALRTAIVKACKAAGVPMFSPHDLRHRRISLLHLRGVPWARIGEQVGQRNLAVTANTYTHVHRCDGA